MGIFTYRNSYVKSYRKLLRIKKYYAFILKKFWKVHEL